ncbi:carbonic anhydrase 13-like isoform X2 [Ascaphus truei]|uniref:carbonic anhydrase 13-like isoform X2 n=1 Tax=Ascaphus truei TaxID=8439 RepID=UPI003F59A026
MSHVTQLYSLFISIMIQPRQKSSSTVVIHSVLNLMMQKTNQLHIVHWNSEKYSSFVEAAHQPDGLGVLGVFLKIGEHNTNIARITDALDAIKSKGKQSSFTDFDPSCLFPDCLDFWTYPGSLTVPPLFESVIWIVLKEPISVSSEQLAKFRSLLSTTGAEGVESCCMQTNHRPAQPVKDRKVRASFF